MPRIILSKLSCVSAKVKSNPKNSAYGLKTIWQWSKNNILLVLKLVVLATSLWFLYAKIKTGNFRGLEEVSIQSLLTKPLFWAVFGLMFINWGLEALKWKLLVNRFEQVSYYTAIKSVFTGVFISLFVNILVPNRLGEFAGRILYVKLHKVKAALISTIGSFGQFIITILAGSIAYLVFWFSFYYQPSEKFSGYLLVAAVVFVSGLAVLLYFNINVVSWVLSKFKFLRRFKKITSVFYFYDSKRLFKVFSLSLVRYAVFCLQFILLLWLMEVNITLIQGIIAVPIIFLVQTVVPSNALSDLGVRGVASIQFLNYYSTNDGGILLAAYLLWGINIFLPGIAGAVFFTIFKFKNVNSNGANN